MADNFSFEKIRDQLGQKLESRLECVDGDPLKRFAPRNVARDVIRSERERVESLYVAAQVNLRCPIMAVHAAPFAARLGEDVRPLHRIMATLISMQMSLEDFQNFEYHLLNGSSQNATLDDDNLPLDEEHWTRLFGQSGNKFYKAQFSWCPIILQERKKVEYRGTRRFCPLPRLSKKFIGAGAYGEVNEVEIEEGHIEFSKGRSRKALYAQKDFVVAEDQGSAFEAEWGVIQQIINARTSHDNICTPLAGLIHGDETRLTFSMFSDLATCNLREYLNGDSAKLPDETYPTGSGGFRLQEKQALLYQAISLVDALDYLHRGLNVPADTIYACWHLDLKPQNVLVTLNSLKAKGGVLFQIADFGVSRLKSVRCHSQMLYDSKGQPLTRIFQSRIAGSATIGRAGDASDCLAPEAYGEGSGVNQSSDLWSMGCILSMLLTYIEGGPTSVQTFAVRRAQSPRYGSWFFDRRTCEIPPSDPVLYYDTDQGHIFERNSSVDHWLHYIVTSSSKAEKPILRKAVDILLTRILVPNPTGRADAQDAYILLETLWFSYGIVQLDDTGGRVPRPKHSQAVCGSSAADKASSLESLTQTRTGKPVGSGSDYKSTRMFPSSSPHETVEAHFSALCKASVTGDVALVRLELSDIPLEHSLWTEYASSPVSIAAEHGHVAVVRLLFEQLGSRAASAYRTDNFGRYPVTSAAEHGHAQVVQYLIETGGVDPDCTNTHGMTSLCCASRNGHVQVVDTLLRSQLVDVDRPDSNGRTPLSWACQGGYIAVVRLLLKTKKVNVHYIDRFDSSPRQRAVKGQHRDIVELLDQFDKSRRGLRSKLDALRNNSIRILRTWH